MKTITYDESSWQLVPKEPTHDMLSAMAECDGYLPGDRERPGLARWEDYWRMAIAAAPTPPERGPDLEAENAKLRTVMTAAAEEIRAHWDAHCDAEGYGPANLMRRLEEGIPSEYGYTAGRFAELLKAEAALAELVALEDLKERFDAMKQDVPDFATAAVLEGIQAEYQRRKPAALAAAREVLKEQGK